jgi:uncharacterized membrane protein HdeD (DUF308 family)
MRPETIAQLSAKWWTFLVRGIVALGIAAYAFTSPGGTATALAYVVAAYFIVSGVAAVVAGVSSTGVGHCFGLIPLGIVQAALGVYMLSLPGIGPLAFTRFFAIWMITSGVAELSLAIAMGNVIKSEFWLGLLGVPTLAIGWHVVVRPDLGFVALVYTVGFYGVLAGASLIGLVFRIKGAGEKFAARLRPCKCSVLSRRLILKQQRRAAANVQRFGSERNV